MLGEVYESNLVDRIIIEMEWDCRIERRIRDVEDVINVPRDRWHPKLDALLSTRDKAASS